MLRLGTVLRGGKPPLFSGFQEQKSAFTARCPPGISIILHQQLFSTFHGITRAAAVTHRLAAIFEVFSSCTAVAISRWWCFWTWDVAVDVFKPKPEDRTLPDLTGPHRLWVGSNLNFQVLGLSKIWIRPERTWKDLKVWWKQHMLHLMSTNQNSLNYSC